jgi:hypothetical protein
MSTIPYYRGDTWTGANFTTTWNGGVPPVPAASARLQFRRDALVEELSTANGKLVITNAVAWDFTCLPQILENVTKEGNWEWDLEITDTSGTVTTIAKGILQVEADVTR